VYGFSLPVLLFCIGGFVLVHFLLPKKSSVDEGFYEIFDLVLDLPYRTIATIIRSIGRLFRDGDGGVDLDI
jgi:hypothetical protein